MNEVRIGCVIYTYDENGELVSRTIDTDKQAEILAKQIRQSNL